MFWPRWCQQRAIIFSLLLTSLLVYAFYAFRQKNLAEYEWLVVRQRVAKLFASGSKRRSANASSSIAIFVMVERRANLQSQYPISYLTLQCYCLANGYPLVLVDLSANATLQRLCPQKDFMFRRHCALAHFLADHPHIQWTLFVDADMAVVNPAHSLEQYLPNATGTTENNAVDLVFYERIFNGEITAGSYLARNSDGTRLFLHFWADYFYKLPRSWHGTDNGAIHAAFLDLFCADGCSERREICWKLWRTSRVDDDLRMFTDCTKSILGKRNVFESTVVDGRSSNNGTKLTLNFVTDFRRFWSRDLWLTDSQWANRDFMVHGFKKKWQNSTKWGGWKSPFRVEGPELGRLLDPEKCANGAAEWPYAPEFMVDDQAVEEKLAGHVRETRKLHLDYVRRIEEFAQKEGTF